MIDPVQRLVAIEAIKALKARYCWYCDDPERYHLFPELFTDDAVFIEEPIEHLEGKAAIASWNETYAQEVAWSRHYAVTPLIEVADDGLTATGRWQALLLSIQIVDGQEQMLWASGTYVEDYRLVAGQWLFSRIHASGRWMTGFEEGFVEDLALFDR
jgi:ketosteroid isomerase-like protein